MLSSGYTGTYETRTDIYGNTYTASGGSGGLRSWYPTPTAAPVAPAAPASIAPSVDNNFSASTWGRTIPISAGQRRLPGDLIWLKGDQLNSDGSFTATGAWSFGYALVDGVEASLTKLWANGIKLYDATTGFTAEGFSFTFYDGNQTTANATMVADKGAANVPAYKKQLYIVPTISTVPFNGMLPNISALITDTAGGTLFSPWGGTWDPDNKHANIELSGDDLIADAASGTDGDSVLGTQPRSSGKYTFAITGDVVQGADGTGLGMGIGLANSSADTQYYMGSQDANSFRWGADGTVYQLGLLTSVWVSYNDGDDVALFVDLEERVVWGTKDGVTFYGGGAPCTASEVAQGLRGLDISGIPGALYPALTLAVDADKATGNFSDGAFLATVGEPGALTLAQVITAVGARCGYSEADFTFVGVDDIDVTGVVITQDTDLKSFLLNAGRTYGFDYTESGSTILIKKSVVGSTYTLDKTFVQADLMPLDKKGTVETTRSEEQGLPTVIEFLYQDESIDFQPSMQRARRHSVNSTIVDSFAVPFVMSATEALTGAATALFREWQQRVVHRIRVRQGGLRIEPTDVISFPSASKTHVAKVIGSTLNSDLSRDITAVNLLTAENAMGDGFAGDPNDDNVPLFAPPSDMALSPSTVAENSAQGTVIGELTTTGGTAPYTYAITAQERAGWFQIVGDEVQVGPNSPDYEVDASATVTIEVTDDHGGTYEETFAITITDEATGSPTITSSATASVAENATLSHALTSTPVATWTIVGGADQSEFEISGTTLRWVSNGTKDFESPNDADTNNTYVVTVRASAAGETNDQTITVTVTDVSEIASTTWDSAFNTFTVSYSAADKTATHTGFGTTGRNILATTSQSSGTHTASVVATDVLVNTFYCIGLAGNSVATVGNLGVDANLSVGYYADGSVKLNSATVATLASYTDGDTIDLEYDFSAETVRFRKNGGSWSSTVSISALPGTLYVAASLGTGGEIVTAV
jgi:hypothetical protein